MQTQLSKLNIQYRQSPNYHQRVEPPKIIVLHKIALPLSNPCLHTVCDFFENKLPDSKSHFMNSLTSVRVSSHYVIGLDGKIVQCVCPKTQVAWHCGYSKYLGQEKCNEFSIGIEFVGFDFEDLTPDQYIAGQDLIKALRDDFQIERSCVVGHRDIAPARKTDPGLYIRDKLVI